MRVQLATSLRSRLRGLLGRESFGGVLVLAPCRDIHTFGMSDAIDFAFVAPDGTVLAAHRNVPPGKRLRCRSAALVLERFSTDTPWLAKGETIEIAERRTR